MATPITIEEIIFLANVPENMSFVKNRLGSLKTITTSPGRKHLPMAAKQLSTGEVLPLRASTNWESELVTVLAKFSPKIVRMADANRKEGRED